MKERQSRRSGYKDDTFQISERRIEDTFQRRERGYVQIKVIGVERSNDRVKKKYIAVLIKGRWT